MHQRAAFSDGAARQQRSNNGPTATRALFFDVDTNDDGHHVAALLTACPTIQSQQHSSSPIQNRPNPLLRAATEIDRDAWGVTTDGTTAKTSERRDDTSTSQSSKTPTMLPATLLRRAAASAGVIRVTVSTCHQSVVG